MTTEQSDAVDAIRAQREADAYPGRCTFTWTPTTDSDFCFPEVRCTNRSAAIHRHAWNAVEEDQWKTRALAIRAQREAEADPTLGPDGTEAVDMDPTGCPYIWTPGPTSALSQMFERVRCTRPIHDDDRHHWDAREQRERSARVTDNLLAAMGPEHAALTKPLTKTPITITGLKPGTDYTVRNVRINDGEPVTITTPSTEHLPNAINRLQAYIDARTGPGHAARALRDENTHTILLDDLGAVLQAASRAIVLERVEEPRLSVDELAQIMCRLEGLNANRPFDEVVAPGIELWMRHRHEAEALLAELRDAGYVA